MLFVLFFLLKIDKIISVVRHILPLSRSQEDKLPNSEIERVSKSTVMGSFLTAISASFAGGLGMWIAGFPVYSGAQ